MCRGSRPASRPALRVRPCRPGGQNYVTDRAEITSISVATNCTTTVGSPTLTRCTNATRCFAGDVVQGTVAVPTGAIVASVSAPNITLGGGITATASLAGISVNCYGHYIAPNTLIVSGARGPH